MIDRETININVNSCCDMSVTNNWLEVISKQLETIHDTIKLLVPVPENKQGVIHTLKFHEIKLTGDKKMNGKMQVDQTGVWGMQFLNDNGVPVQVPTFEAVSSVPEFTVTIVLPDPINGDDWTYKVRITASGEASGEINAKGITASGTELPATLGLTSIPDEAESVSETFTVEENP